MLLAVHAIGRTLWKLLLLIGGADVFSGLVHWWEDRYGKESWPLLGRTVIAPNRQHHAQPRAFLSHGTWSSIDIQVLLAGVVLALAWLVGCCSLELALVLVLLVAANVFHRWSHRTARENGRFITLLQRLHLVQSRAHHGLHHARGHDRHYCSVTPWLDPLLDRLHLWQGLERLIAGITGIRPLTEAG